MTKIPLSEVYNFVRFTHMAKSGRPLKVDPILDDLFLDIENKNNEKVISVLEEHGVDAFDGDKRTALIHCAYYGNLELAQWCIEHGADVNFKDKLGQSALFGAAQEGQIEIAELLLKAGADINIQNEHGNYPLMEALVNWNGGVNEPMINFLIEHGADVNQKNNYGVCAKDRMGDGDA